MHPLIKTLWSWLSKNSLNKVIGLIVLEKKCQKIFYKQMSMILSVVLRPFFFFHFIECTNIAHMATLRWFGRFRFISTSKYKYGIKWAVSSPFSFSIFVFLVFFFMVVFLWKTFLSALMLYWNFFKKSIEHPCHFYFLIVFHVRRSLPHRSSKTSRLPGRWT